MKGIIATTMGVLAILQIACNKYVEKSKYEETQQQLQATRSELEESERKLAEARKQVQELSEHKFSTYSSGLRTWRFNSETGEICILLTSESDWKNKKTKNQSCDCQDNRAEWYRAWKDAKSNEDRKEITEIWSPILKDACGE